MTFQIYALLALSILCHLWLFFLTSQNAWSAKKDAERAERAWRFSVAWQDEITIPRGRGQDGPPPLPRA